MTSLRETTKSDIDKQYDLTMQVIEMKKEITLIKNMVKTMYLQMGKIIVEGIKLEEAQKFEIKKGDLNDLQDK